MYVVAPAPEVLGSVRPSLALMRGYQLSSTSVVYDAPRETCISRLSRAGNSRPGRVALRRRYTTKSVKHSPLCAWQLAPVVIGCSA
jgi:hypothetical protein